MRRRTVLAVVGAGVVGGYVWLTKALRPATPDGMDVDTRYLERDVILNETAAVEGELDFEQERHALVPDRGVADRTLRHFDSVSSFVENTDFDRSYLVVIETMIQSEADLQLDAISRIDDGLRFTLSIEYPGSVGDDAATHGQLVRITDSEGGVPDRIAVDISGYE